jgi:hypothetical protein
MHQRISGSKLALTSIKQVEDSKMLTLYLVASDYQNRDRNKKLHEVVIDHITIDSVYLVKGITVHTRRYGTDYLLLHPVARSGPSVANVVSPLDELGVILRDLVIVEGGSACFRFTMAYSRSIIVTISLRGGQPGIRAMVNDAAL